MVKKREGFKFLIQEPYLTRIKQGLCPVCAKPKKKWKRTTSYRCCSKECSDKFYSSTEYTTVHWSQVRVKAFERDDHTCQDCGEKKEESELIADHITPVALGGDEWDLSNVQTLCKECDKKKTSKDLKEIAKLRRKEKILKHHKPLQEYNMAKEFLKFRYDKNKKVVFIINNKKETIGEIIYHEPWKRWAHLYYAQTLVDDKCQLQTLKKLVKLNKIRKS